MLKPKWIYGLLLCGQLTPATLRAEEPQPQPPSALEAVITQEAPRVTIAQTAPDATNLLEVTAQGLAYINTEQPSKYWIGLGCEAPTEALKSQLGLADKSALLVTMVADESPAKTAGFQIHDVLTTVKLGEDSQPLDNVTTLTNSVTKAEQKPITLTVIRQGKPQEITVTPAERPQAKQDFLVGNFATVNVTAAPANVAANNDRVQLLLRELQSAITTQSQPTTIHFTGPVVTPPTAPVPPVPPGVPHIVVMTKPELPDNVTITITKTGKEPARIKYQQGEGKSWGATETEINTLPPEGQAALQMVLAALHHPTLAGMMPPHAGVVSEWPVRHIYKSEIIKGQGLNANSGVSGVITKSVPSSKTATPEEAAARLQSLEKRMELVQKQQQELLTKQQETIRKEMQALREALEKIEKK